MAGIYLPIEIPKNCFTDDCPCCDGENGRCQADKERRYVDGDRPYWCPLVALPDCGRLIDADALYKKLERIAECSTGYVKDRTYEMMAVLQVAPTIIPGDKEDANANDR